MSTPSNLCLLQNAPINLIALREASKRQLFDIIESVNIVSFHLIFLIMLYPTADISILQVIQYYKFYTSHQNV